MLVVTLPYSVCQIFIIDMFIRFDWNITAMLVLRFHRDIIIMLHQYLNKHFQITLHKYSFLILYLCLFETF